LSYALVPIQIGITGGLHIGEAGGDVSVYLGKSANVLYAQLDNIRLSDLFTNLFQGLNLGTPPGLITTITNVGFKMLKIYLNPSPNTIVVHGKTYPSGFEFAIRELNLWDFIKGSAEMSFDYHNLHLNATLEPISMLNGSIVISGARSDSDPAVFQLDVGADVATVIHISGGINLFKNRLAADVSLSDGVFQVAVNMR